MTEPALFDPEATPSVALDGREWPIPELVWRDLKKCRRELIELTGRLNEAISDSDADAADGEQERGLRHTAVMDRVFDDLSNDDCDRLVMGVIFAGVVAAHPTLTKDEFHSWRISETERRIAWLVVRGQSGLFVSRAGDTQPGERVGAP